MAKEKPYIVFENTDFPKINNRKFPIEYIHIDNNAVNSSELLCDQIVKIITDEHSFVEWFERVFDNKEFNLAYDAKIYTSEGCVMQCHGVNILSHWNPYKCDFVTQTIEFNVRRAEIIKYPEKENNNDDALYELKTYIDDIDKTKSYLKSLSNKDDSITNELIKYIDKLKDICIEKLRDSLNK